jgi:formate dehydrogenase
LLRFFEEESCGQCTPCRLGCTKLIELVESKTQGDDIIQDLSQVMRDASICGLGQAAPNPVLSAMKFFADEL